MVGVDVDEDDIVVVDCDAGVVVVEYKTLLSVIKKAGKVGRFSLLIQLFFSKHQNASIHQKNHRKLHLGTMVTSITSISDRLSRPYCITVSGIFYIHLVGRYMIE